MVDFTNLLDCVRKNRFLNKICALFRIKFCSKNVKLLSKSIEYSFLKCRNETISTLLHRYINSLVTAQKECGLRCFALA